MPACWASSTTCWINGRSTTGSISFGMALVAGRKRVPKPATGKMALRIRVMRNFRHFGGVNKLFESAQSMSFIVGLHGCPNCKLLTLLKRYRGTHRRGSRADSLGMRKTYGYLLTAALLAAASGAAGQSRDDHSYSGVTGTIPAARVSLAAASDWSGESGSSGDPRMTAAEIGRASCRGKS